MIPAEWLKKVMVKSIPILAETLLKQAEKQPLQEGETDYNHLLIARRDKVTGHAKLLVFQGAGNFTEKPYKITRIITATNIGEKIESMDFEAYKSKLKIALKDGTLETGLKELNIKDNA
jgi:hypothetical protein